MQDTMAPKRKRPKPAGNGGNPWPARLKRLRKRLGGDRSISQAEAAEKVGVSLRSWAGYEAGDRDPPQTVAILIALLEQGKTE